MMPTYRDVADVALLCERWPELAEAIEREGIVTVEHVTLDHTSAPTPADACPAVAVRPSLTLTYPVRMVEEERARREREERGAAAARQKKERAVDPPPQPVRGVPRKRCRR